jgi:predicted nuclease with TOPRIM domain
MKRVTLTAEQREIARLFDESMRSDEKIKKLNDQMEDMHRRFHEMDRLHKSTIYNLTMRQAEIMAKAAIHKKAIKRATLIKLDGYLMALSEIGNDRDQGRSNQLRGGEDQPQAGQDGDNPDLGHPPE